MIVVRLVREDLIPDTGGSRLALDYSGVIFSSLIFEETKTSTEQLIVCFA